MTTRADGSAPMMSARAASPVLLRHRDVQRHEVERELPEAGDGLGAIARLTDDLVAGGRQGIRDHLAHERGVIDDEHAGHGVILSS